MEWGWNFKYNGQRSPAGKEREACGCQGRVFQAEETACAKGLGPGGSVVGSGCCMKASEAEP